MGKLFRRIHYLLNRHRLERELEQEMAAHREMMAADRRTAFGNTLLLREDARDAWGWTWLVHSARTLRTAVRGFLRERRFALSTITAITLAVGAATAVFSVVDRSLFRPLPYFARTAWFRWVWSCRASEGRIHVSRRVPRLAGFGARRARPHLLEWRDRKRPPASRRSSGWTAARVEATFSRRSVSGRLSGELYRRRRYAWCGTRGDCFKRNMAHTFRERSAVLGKRINIDEVSALIVGGVLPAGFEMPDLSPADLFLPQKQPTSLREGAMCTAKVIGRLREQPFGAYQRRRRCHTRSSSSETTSRRAWGANMPRKCGCTLRESADRQPTQDRLRTVDVARRGRGGSSHF